jgi:ribosomal protein S18 acetylase RimI-like enzyme
MEEPRRPVATVIRQASALDAEGIARVFLESADYHARLDPERYAVPDADAIAARYRDGRKHPAGEGENGITLAAELGGEIAGFVDIRLDRSPDPMHRDITYCHVVEIAVGVGHQNRGIGRLLLAAAEDWGRQNGATFASLEYLADNSRAAALYERLAYRVASITAIKRL